MELVIEVDLFGKLNLTWIFNFIDYLHSFISKIQSTTDH